MVNSLRTRRKRTRQRLRGAVGISGPSARMCHMKACFPYVMQVRTRPTRSAQRALSVEATFAAHFALRTDCRVEPNIQHDYSLQMIFLVLNTY